MTEIATSTSEPSAGSQTATCAADACQTSAPVAAQAISADPPVLFDDLVERCMGNIDLATQLLAGSQTHLVNDLTGLRQSQQHGDVKEFTRIAHRLKGATASLGAYELSDVFARIEHNGRANEAAPQVDSLQDLETAWTRFTDCVAELCSQD